MYGASSEEHFLTTDVGTGSNAQWVFGAAAMRSSTSRMDTSRNQLNVDVMCVAKLAGGAVFISILIFVIFSSENAFKCSASMHHH